MEQREKNAAALNRLVITTIAVVTSAAVLGNTVGVLKGEKEIFGAIIFFLIGAVTTGNSFIQYKRNPASDKLRYHGCIGFLILYTFTVLTTERNLVFIYIIPIIYIATMYNDLKFIKFMSITFLIISIIAVINLAVVLKISNEHSFMNYTIQVIASLVVSVTSILNCKLNMQFNEDNMRMLVEANEKQQAILNEVLEIGGILDERSKEVNTIVNELQGSSEVMTEVMDAMLEGVHKTAVSIDNQKDYTNNIQLNVEETSNQTKQMNSISDQSIHKVEEGVQIMKDLTKNTNIMNSSGQQVAQSMNDLRDKTAEINQITVVISEIAKKINILSLNASIESARAGEAGKSFAVVAGEIGNLAAQTTQSVAGIASIIVELQKMVESVSASLKEFGAISLNQNSLIGLTEDIFDEMNHNMKQVYSMVSNVTEQVETIVEANHQVMQNVELLAAEGNESRNNIESSVAVTEKNMEQVEQAKHVADELLAASQRLQKYI